MLIMAQSIDAKVMKRGQNVSSNPVTQPTSIVTPPVPALSPIPAPMPAPVMKVDQDAIKKRLDEQLSSPVETAWNDRINDIFDLAMVNRELARDYFIKMRQKMVEAGVGPVELIERPASAKATEDRPSKEAIEKTGKSVEPSLPAGEEPMKKATGKPAPSRKLDAPKVEPAEGVPSGEEPMKKAEGRPAPSRKPGAPSGGPAKNIGGAKPGAAKPGTTQEAPKVAEQIFSVSKLQQLDNDKLLELFNDLLDKLGTVPSNWNGMAVEKVEEKTKYGSKIYNVYGVPVPDWTRKIDTLKKVLISKNVTPEAEVTQKIADRIAQVRVEKAVAKPIVQPEQEKAKEELTEDDLVKLIKAQFADPKTDQIGWVVSIKGNIKALDKLNHATAMQYHDQFIKLLPKEKPFLK